jgi:hypothetical protein
MSDIDHQYHHQSSIIIIIIIITIIIIIIICRHLTPPIGIPALSGSTVKGQTAKSAITATSTDHR